MTDTETPKKVLLCADCLLSKWGFHDGDQLDWLYDFIQELGDFDAHDVLVEAVKTKLLPALNHDIETEIICCNHNPIRASKINGKDIREKWYNSDYAFDWGTTDHVTISGKDILDIARHITSANKST